MSGIDVDTGEHPQTTRREPEESDTFRWRFDQLRLAGYSEPNARQLAISPSGKRVAVLANGGVYVLSR